MTMSSDSMLEESNARLNSTVQELRLEIAYYQGETKRLEWEKNLLKQDVGKMSALFKGWLHELQNSYTRNVSDDSHFFSNLVRNPSKNISDLLKMKDAKVLLTTCQAPFYIEYTNKAWSIECGWGGHEVLGLTCAFLQGELTDIKTAAAFTKDVKEVGYGNMRINNYRKNGTVFNASITVFPIYDSVGTGDEPVLTHFATVLEEIRNITEEDVLQSQNVPTSVTRMLADNINVKSTGSYLSTQSQLPLPLSNLSTAQIIQQALIPVLAPLSLPLSTSTQTPPSCSFLTSTRVFDRRVQSRRFEAECRLTSENFEKSGKDARISDLLRLMLTCVDAMVLTDKDGKVIHCNKEWVELTGYSLSEVEGCDCKVLQGSMTNHAEIRRCSALQKLNKSSTMNVVNYRKDGSMFINNVTTVPIRGGYRTDEVTHFCALLLPQPPEYANLENILVLNSYDSDSNISLDSSTYHAKRTICDVNKFDCEDSDYEYDNTSGCKTPKIDEEIDTDGNTNIEHSPEYPKSKKINSRRGSFLDWVDGSDLR